MGLCGLGGYRKSNGLLGCGLPVCSPARGLVGGAPAGVSPCRLTLYGGGYTCILLYVQLRVSVSECIITPGPNIQNIMMLPGEGEAYPSCTDVVGWRKCPTCGYAEPMTQNCSRVTCPVCYTHWVKKAATRVSNRIHGFSYACTHPRPSDDSVYSVCSVVTSSKTKGKVSFIQIF